MFNVSDSVVTNNVNFYQLAAQTSGQDVTDFFDTSAEVFPGCGGFNGAFATTNLCTNSSADTHPTCPLGVLDAATFGQLRIVNASYQVGYTWDQLVNMTNYLVINGDVLNMTPYMLAHPDPIPNDPVDASIRYALRTMDPAGGKDATRLFTNRVSTTAAMQCLQRYSAGHIDKITPGCFASQLFLYCALVVILGLVLARFVMAVIFSWFLSRRLIMPPKNLKRHGVSPAVMPAGANLTKESRAGTAPWTGAKLQKGRGREGKDSEKGFAGGVPLPVDHNGMISMASIGPELFCVCLVTCYSEGEEGIRTTLDSIAGSNYSDARKLLFVVCDGMITGSGENRSTPDICVGLIESDPRFGTPTPMSYLAVAAGQKAHNQAMVYCGHYSASPLILAVGVGPCYV
jgi:chitin synthase